MMVIIVNGFMLVKHYLCFSTTPIRVLMHTIKECSQIPMGELGVHVTYSTSKGVNHRPYF